MTNNPIAKSIHAIYLLNISAMIEEFELLQKIQNDTDRNLKVKSMPGKKTRWLFHTEFVGYILYSREDGVLLNHNLQMRVLFCDLAAHVRLYIYICIKQAFETNIRSYQSLSY